MNITGSKAAFAALFCMTAAMPAHADPFSEIDFSQIRNVIFEGESSKINVTTSKDGPAMLHVVKSGLRAQSCRPIVETRAIQASLYVNLQFKQSDTGVTRRCSVLLETQLPTDVSVSIHQQATIASFKGHFQGISVAGTNSQVSLVGQTETFNLESSNSVVTIDGKVNALEIDANRTIAALRLTDLSETRTLRIHADNLVAEIGLPESAQIKHNIRATISAFASSIPLQQEADLALDIRSELMSGKLFAF
ncbi:hypothetical protein [uncultured Roseibium sp.]|uniref:hypothetical protein n=1 Tax=uncultured Roseibium sp. TaxID=1936171 RepID=UPI002610E34A|nr:hypothetical protein [uncultured Roseibium sp.]